MNTVQLSMIILGGMIVLFVPFIVCDLVFSSRDIDCLRVRQPLPVNLDLWTWLRVDAFTRIGAVVCLPFLVGMTFTSDKMVKILPGAILGIAYALFFLAWEIIGCIMISHLNQHKKCAEQRQLMDYFIANCIVSLVLVFAPCGGKD